MNNTIPSELKINNNSNFNIIIKKKDFNWNK